MTSDEKLWSIIAHLSGIGHSFGAFFMIFCPLAIMIAYKDRSQVIYEQAKEALNYQISFVILTVIAFFCFISIVGIPIAIGIWLIVAIGSWLFPIIAAIRLNEGERYRYPFTIRLF